jgi:ABC-type transport system involved in multi-copper enzyme maturation permease subunit
MWTLIKREMRDNIIFLLLGLIAAGICQGVIASSFFEMETKFAPVGIYETAYIIFLFFLPALAVLATAMGGVQMYLDRSRKVSAFLGTLAVTRGRLLTAKMLAGAVFLVAAILPLAAGQIIYLQAVPRLIPPDYSLLVRMYIGSLLCALACYMLGSNLGLGRNRIAAFFAGIAGCALLVSLIIIKGFGTETMLLLVVTSAVLCVRVRNEFESVPL